MHNDTHLHAHTSRTQICWIGSDLSDLAASTCLLNAPVSSLPSSKRSFAILSKAGLMPPITGGLQAGRFGARRLGMRVCYASGPFNRVVICCWWCWSCLCRLINGKLPSLWWSACSTKPKLWGEPQKKKKNGVFLTTWYRLFFTLTVEEFLHLCTASTNEIKAFSVIILCSILIIIHIL